MAFPGILNGFCTVLNHRELEGCSACGAHDRIAKKEQRYPSTSMHYLLVHQEELPLREIVLPRCVGGETSDQRRSNVRDDVLHAMFRSLSTQRETRSEHI